MPLCEECNKPLRIFKKRLDFNGRELHLKCWKELQLQYLYQREMDYYLEIHKNSLGCFTEKLCNAVFLGSN
jgi:hypothetical protein